MFTEYGQLPPGVPKENGARTVGVGDDADDLEPDALVEGEGVTGPVLDGRRAGQDPGEEVHVG